MYIEGIIGVTIQDTEGSYHLASEWDGSKTANGVAIVTENCKFILAIEEPTQANDYKIYYDNTICPDLPIHNGSSSAITEYDGEYNTNKMIAVYGSGNTYAAGACTNYIFPNGKNGYLGAAGEWNAVLDNLESVNECLTKCGGTSLQVGKYWTSTRRGNASGGICYFWYANTETDSMGNHNVENNYFIRPLCKF